MDNNAVLKFFKPLKDFWDNLEKKKRIRYGILTGIVLLVIIFSVMMLNRQEYVVLYSNLESKEAGEIMNKLTEMKVEAKAQGTGTIMVPSKKESTLRMQLSAEGYPQSGLNYDIFKNSTGFGTTDFEKQKYMQFQLQDRLQGSIKSLDIVEDAIVTLYIPDSTSFVLKSDKQAASASVILKMRTGQKLSSNQVKGIIGLISKSVPGLSEEQVFLVDSTGASLNKTASNEAELAGTQLELENTVSEKYKQQIESMLEPVFGSGKVIAGVRVELDFDKQTTEKTLFEPVGDGNSGILVSGVESRETATGSQGAGNTGLDANGGAPTYPEVETNAGTYQKTEKTQNYEINKIKDLVQKSEGNIKNISVSIILDNASLQAGADEKVKSIVAGATGINPENVIVQTMDFSGSTNTMNEILANNQKAQEDAAKMTYMRNAIIFGAAGLALLIAIFVIVMVKNKSKQNNYDVDEFIEDENNATGNQAINMMDDDDFDYDFGVKKSEQRRIIEKNIDSNPEFVAQLLRNWLDEYGG